MNRFLTRCYSRLKRQLFNTPPKYWVVINGYHLHKSFWGVCILVLGILFLTVVLVVVGLILISLSVAGHIHTNNKPYFKLWDKEERPQ